MPTTDRVQRNREKIVITKNDKPVAKLVPVNQSTSRSVFGYLQDSVEVVGDIVSPPKEDWEVEQ